MVLRPSQSLRRKQNWSCVRGTCVRAARVRVLDALLPWEFRVPSFRMCTLVARFSADDARMSKSNARLATVAAAAALFLLVGPGTASHPAAADSGSPVTATNSSTHANSAPASLAKSEAAITEATVVPSTGTAASVLGDWTLDVRTSAMYVGAKPAATASGASAPVVGGDKAVSIEQLEQVWPTLSPKQQFDAVEQLLRAKRPDIAELLLKNTNYAYPGDAKVARFYLALAAKGQQRHDEAIGEFRALLAEDPQFNRVRLELAHTLYITNQDEAAHHHFDLVLGASGTNPNLENTVRSYLGAIDGRRRWDFSAYFTIAPSTNMNQGGESRVVYLNGLPFVINDANLKKSGVGINAGFQGSYRQPVNERLDIIFSGGLHTKTFRDDDFNTALGTVSVGPRYKFDWGFLGLYGLIENQWHAQENYSLSFGGLLSGSVRLGPKNVLYGDLLCSRRRFDDDWSNQDLTYQDGHVCSATGRLDHYVDSATLVRVLGGGGQERTSLTHSDNDSWFAGAGVYRELPLGLTVYLQALYTEKQYDGDYPTLTEARHDQRWDFSVNLTKRDWVFWGFAPQVQYTYTTNASNVPFHQYDAHGVNLTFTKRF